MLGQAPRQAASQPLSPPKSDSRLGKLRGVTGMHPRADSQRTAKNSAARSSEVVSCSQERRGQSREGVTGGRCLHPHPQFPPSFRPHPGVPGAPWEPNPGGRAEGSLEGADTVQAAGRRVWGQ